ncbi:hypothetical protein [Acidithrix ferrooxidans]|uniref:hypothetical protein n=1 Tax=Acidithrix ferrooxidans TaxID=1280514 RepID=UPI00126A3913|nr:hypothetical protein [Acidithrix ferrooxidans]
MKAALAFLPGWGTRFQRGKTLYLALSDLLYPIRIDSCAVDETVWNYLVNSDTPKQRALLT